MLSTTGIETRHHGPTNSRGARVSARRADHDPAQNDPIRFYPYRSDKSVLDAHRNAALEYLRECGYHAELWDDIVISTRRGYIFPLRFFREGAK